jgi:hypothetical protein
MKQRYVVFTAAEVKVVIEKRLYLIAPKAKYLAKEPDRLNQYMHFKISDAFNREVAYLILLHSKVIIPTYYYEGLKSVQTSAEYVTEYIRKFRLFLVIIAK